MAEAAEASRGCQAADQRVFDLWDEIRLDHQAALLVDGKAKSRIEARREIYRSLQDIRKSQREAREEKKIWRRPWRRSGRQRLKPPRSRKS